jgi:hypothetical protein
MEVDMNPLADSYRGAHLSDIVRIFSTSTSSPITIQPVHMPGTTSREHRVVATTDGSCMNSGHLNAAAGAGIFYKRDNARNKAIRIPRNIEQSNQTAELIAIRKLIRNTPNECELTIESDSMYAINAITKHHGRSENEGFIKTKRAPIISF